MTSEPPKTEPTRGPLAGFASVVAGISLPSWVARFFLSEEGFIVCSTAIRLPTLGLVALGRYFPMVITR